MGKNDILRQIPRVDILAERLSGQAPNLPADVVLDSCRVVLDKLREAVNAEEITQIPPVDVILESALAIAKEGQAYSLRPVINASGVVIHTNLGRAVLSKTAAEYVKKIAESYSTLEYDVASGERGSRHAHIEPLICALTGAEAAMAVNNNAAAIMLALSSIGGGKEVVVSRGELVEIGGSFRVSEIMALSGAVLKEVGTTNRTNPEDYRRAINENTAALLKVHTSNFKIVGFTGDTCIEQLSEIGGQHNLPVIYDLGSGLVHQIPRLLGEKTAQDSIKKGADIVCFSADKLFGGPQAGIIAGRKALIDKMKRHQLARVVRIDKLTLAALEATLKEYLSGLSGEIPTIKFLLATEDELKKKAEKLKKILSKNANGYRVLVAESEGQVGGGSAPGEVLHSYAVAVASEVSAVEIERNLRTFDTPIITRIHKGNVLIDVRTVDEADFVVIDRALKSIFS